MLLMKYLTERSGLNPLKQVKSFGPQILMWVVNVYTTGLNPLKQVKSFGQTWDLRKHL